MFNEYSKVMFVKETVKMKDFKYEIPIPGYSVRLATQEDLENVLHFLEKNFNREELIFKTTYANSTITEEENKLIDEDHDNLSRSIFNSSPCLIAFHESSDKIVGINMTIITPSPKRAKEERIDDVIDVSKMKSTFMKKCMNYLDGISKRAELFDEVFPNAESGIEFYAISVDQDHRRRGLALELINAGVALGKTIENVSFAFAITTSRFSTRAAIKGGMRPILEVEYEDGQQQNSNSIISVVAVEL